MRKRIIVICIVVALIAVAVVGTVAYFNDTTETKENTFTLGKVDIELTETSPEGYGVQGTATDKGFDFSGVVPGTTYAKAPVITVQEGSLDAYVFVEFTVKGYNDLYAALEADEIDATVLDALLVNKDSHITSANIVDYGMDADDNFHIVYYLGQYAEQSVIGVFTGVQIPAELDKGCAILEGKTIGLDVTGYAVQLENVADQNAAWAAVDPGNFTAE